MIDIELGQVRRAFGIGFAAMVVDHYGKLPATAVNSAMVPDARHVKMAMQRLCCWVRKRDLQLGRQIIFRPQCIRAIRDRVSRLTAVSSSPSIESAWPAAVDYSFGARPDSISPRNQTQSENAYEQSDDYCRPLHAATSKVKFNTNCQSRELLILREQSASTPS